MWKSPLLRFPSVRGNGGKPAVGFPPFPQRVISTDSRWNLFTHRLCYRTDRSIVVNVANPDHGTVELIPDRSRLRRRCRKGNRRRTGSDIPARFKVNRPTVE